MIDGQNMLFSYPFLYALSDAHTKTKESFISLFLKCEPFQLE
jgi:hypothetical protein